jgi:hypothetical protein
MARKTGFVDNTVTMLHRNFRDRISAFSAYSKNGVIECACCHIDEFSFLSLDHVDGKGNTERALIFGNRLICGHHMYRELRRRGFPPGYQILCMNCQVGRRDNGGICPHKSTSKPLTADQLLNEFEVLRVGSKNYEATKTDAYLTSLARLTRKTISVGLPMAIEVATSSGTPNRPDLSPASR